MCNIITVSKTNKLNIIIILLLLWVYTWILILALRYLLERNDAMTSCVSRSRKPAQYGVD